MENKKLSELSSYIGQLVSWRIDAGRKQLRGVFILTHVSLTPNKIIDCIPVSGDTFEKELIYVEKDYSLRMSNPDSESPILYFEVQFEMVRKLYKITNLDNQSECYTNDPMSIMDFALNNNMTRCYAGGLDCDETLAEGLFEEEHIFIKRIYTPTVNSQFFFGKEVQEPKTIIYSIESIKLTNLILI